MSPGLVLSIQSAGLDKFDGMLHLDLGIPLYLSVPEHGPAKLSQLPDMERLPACMALYQLIWIGTPSTLPANASVNTQPFSQIQCIGTKT